MKLRITYKHNASIEFFETYGKQCKSVYSNINESVIPNKKSLSNFARHRLDNTYTLNRSLYEIMVSNYERTKNRIL